MTFAIIHRDGKRFLVKEASKHEWVNASVPLESQQKFDKSECDLLARLGSNPSEGKVYSVPIDVFVRHINIKHVGSIDSYVTEDTKQISNALSFWFKHCYDNGWIRKDICIEYRNLSKKIGAAYKYQPKAEIDKLIIKPLLNEPQHIIIHELGHHIWFHVCTDLIRCEWFKTYRSNIIIEWQPLHIVKQIISDIINSKNIIALVKDYEESELEIVDYILNHTKKHFGIDLKRLQVIATTTQKNIALFMPDPANIKVPIIKRNFSMDDGFSTAYSAENPEEFFCESFALNRLKQLKNKKLITLMKDSLNG